MMPYKSSNWTGRVPRTMNEAFGPEARLSERLEPRYGASVRTGLIGALIGAAIMMTAALCMSDAHAAPLPAYVPEPMVANYYTANDHCQGDQIDPDHNPWCRKRDQIQAVLLNMKYLHSDTDVWVGPITLQRFARVMYTANDAPSVNIERVLRHDMLTAASLRVQFAIWNTPGAIHVLAQQMPRAFPVWVKLMREAEAAHAADNDPTLRLMEEPE